MEKYLGETNRKGKHRLGELLELYFDLLKRTVSSGHNAENNHLMAANFSKL